jgi:hypothetical protein
MSDLIIKKPDSPGGVRWVEFNETKEQNDPVPCFRLYATQSTTSFNLQIRGRVPLGDRHLSKDKKPRNLIATIGLSWEDLVKIAEYVKDIQSSKEEQP